MRSITPLPPFSTRLWLGYYAVMGRVGNHVVDAVRDGANLVMIGPDECDSEWSAQQRRTACHEAAQTAISLGAAIVDPQGGTSRDSIDFFRLYWHSVPYVLVPIVSEDTVAVEACVREYESVIAEYGLPRKPVVWYVDGELSESWRPARGVDVQALNLYVGPPYPHTTAAALAQLHERWHRQAAKVPATLDILLIAQSYDRNGQWTNIPALVGLQSGYASCLTDPRVRGIWWFAYARKGGARTYPGILHWHRVYARMNSRVKGLNRCNPRVSVVQRIAYWLHLWR